MKVQQKINGLIDAVKSISAIIGEEYTTMPETDLNELHQLRKDLLKLVEKLQDY